MGRPPGMATVTVLAAIDGGLAYGLDIIQATGLLPGTVYTTLRRLEARKLVKGRWEDADVAEAERRPRRRYYTLTPGGTAALDEAQQRLREASRGPLVIVPATRERPS